MINLIVLSELQRLEKQAKDLELNDTLAPEEKIEKVEEIADAISKLLENIKLDNLEDII